MYTHIYDYKKYFIKAFQGDVWPIERLLHCHCHVCDVVIWLQATMYRSALWIFSQRGAI